MKRKSTHKEIKTLNELKKDEALFKKVLKVAQFESELDMGVNPKSTDQANTGYLTEKDFEYIKKVCILVEKRLKDSDWLTKTIKILEDRYKPEVKAAAGIRFDDELFKVGRGILESYLNELENKEK